MNKPTELELMPSQKAEMAVVPAPQEGMSIQQAWTAVVQGDMNAERLAVMKQLLAMSAEQKFNAAFVELQKQLPAIHGVRGVPDKTGKIKFVYANFDDIDQIVRPICLAHGFSYSFRETAIADGRVTMTMDLQHAAGHSRAIPYSVRIGQGPPGATESQADVSGHTYAKRGCIESGLSLRVVGDREDARAEGDIDTKITQAQADLFEHRAQLLNCVPSFLAFAKAAKFSEIAASRHQELDQLLARKERQKP